MDGVHILRVTGEVDVYTAPLLEAAIAKCADANAVIVDLSQCRYLAAAGLGVLLRLHKTKGVLVCIVVAAEGFPYKVLCITQLDKKLRVVFAIDEALVHVRS